MRIFCFDKTFFFDSNRQETPKYAEYELTDFFLRIYRKYSEQLF